MGPLPRGPREEAVQGAGMVALFHAQRAAESDASVRLRVRSHVPGIRRDRAQAEDAGCKKAKPQIETPSVGIRLWAVFQRGPAHEPPPENVASGRDVVGMPDRRQTRLCNSSKGKTPREREMLYSFRRKELRDFWVSRARRIPARFVQRGPYIEGQSALRQSPPNYDS
jgi:hypothetical protein